MLGFLSLLQPIRPSSRLYITRPPASKPFVKVLEVSGRPRSSLPSSSSIQQPKSSLKAHTDLLPGDGGHHPRQIKDMTFEKLPTELSLITQNAIRQPPSDLGSRLFAVLNTPCSGLGAFAQCSIPANTDVFRCAGPFVNVVYKPFKKEVCAQCFFYDNGRKLKVAQMGGTGKNARGLAWFCSDECKSAWLAGTGQAGLDALNCISNALARSKKKESTQANSQIRESVRVLEADIEAVWQNAANATEPKQAADLIEDDDDEDTLFFLLDGIVGHCNHPTKWQTFLSLAPSLQPYTESRNTLDSHVRIFRFLRKHLPAEMRSSCTPETVLALITRDHGNSFGIFEAGLEREGEMLGYGSWTEASFFNHSCRPNLKKERVGRSYTFATTRAVEMSEELCISYIGDSSEMPLEERRKRLAAGWGFICRCKRCKDEEAGVH